MNFSISETDKNNILKELEPANKKFQQTYPGDLPNRQAIHTVYGGANLFKYDTCIKMGEIALKNLLEYAPNFCVLAKVLELEGHQHLPTQIDEINVLKNKLDNLNEAERKKEHSWL